jgi:DNA-directed RNA polymerase specialized sigma24 family protein
LNEEEQAEIEAELYFRHFNWLVAVCEANNWQTPSERAFDFASRAVYKIYEKADLFKLDPIWSDGEKQGRFKRWLSRIAECDFKTTLAKERLGRRTLKKYGPQAAPGPGQEDEEHGELELPEEEEDQDLPYAIAPLPLPAPRLELLEYLIEYLQQKEAAGEHARVDFLLTSIKYEVLGPRRRTRRTEFEIDDAVLDNLCKTLKKNRNALRKLRYDLLEEAEAYIRKRVRMARGQDGFPLPIGEVWPGQANQDEAANQNSEAL